MPTKNKCGTNPFTTSGGFSLLIIAVLISLVCHAQNDTSLRNYIKKFKESRFADLMKAQVDFKCPNDTTFFPDSIYVTFTSPEDTSPVKVFGSQSYLIPLEKIAKHGVDPKDKNQVSAFLKEIETKYNTDGCRCGESSPVVKWLLEDQTKELKKYASDLIKLYPDEVKDFDTGKVVFENYQSNDIISTQDYFNGTHILFVNERLLGLSVSLSSLACSFAISTDSAGIPRVAFPKQINDSNETFEKAKKSFVNSILSFHYGCPHPLLNTRMNVQKFVEYMTTFVLAHEYAHANYGHNFYRDRYGDLLDDSQKRKLQLNSWFHEIQADFYAQSILLRKFSEEYPDGSDLFLLTAGAFYLTCIEILEKTRLILNSNDPKADRTFNLQAENFKRLQDIVKPFPTSLKEISEFEVKPEYNPLIDSLISYSHPSPYLRSYNLFNAVFGVLKAKGIDPRDLYFGYDMCQVLNIVLYHSKEELLKKVKK
jgi:hypothetical protein